VTRDFDASNETRRQWGARQRTVLKMAAPAGVVLVLFGVLHGWRGLAGIVSLVVAVFVILLL